MLRYCGPFLVLAGIPLLYYFAGPLWPMAVIFVFLVILVGADAFSSRGRGVAQPSFRRFRLLPLLYVPLQLGVIAWGIVVANISSPATFVLLAFSVGFTAGVFGMLCAHELAHSPGRFDRFVALAMLTGTSNRQFRIAHIFGHHRRAATERDAATARLGENFYMFLMRTLPSQWKEAWEFEQKRCASRAAGLMKNRTLQDVAATILLYVAVFILFGISGVLFLLVESVVAIVTLELFNYIAHYGLTRDIRVNGRKVPVPDFSWNSSNVLANLLIFNMGRHSDHHRRPAGSYQTLSGIAGSPELPLGYAGSILLALVPPLWRRVMDPCVLGIRSRAAQLSNFQQVPAHDEAA
jgi:alkane 1-monooxygenase